MVSWHPWNKLRIHMSIKAVLEGTVAIVQDDAQTARRLELALSEAGAAVFKTTAIRETVDLMWSHKPAAVIIDPGPDAVGALFLAAQAKEQGIVVVHFRMTPETSRAMPAFRGPSQPRLSSRPWFQGSPGGIRDFPSN